MRRAQTVKNLASSRPSLAVATDDLGVLREGEDSTEHTLKRELIQKDREIDQVRINYLLTSGVSQSQ